LGRYLVTFVDNHDQVGQDPKRRFGADCPDDQIIAGIGYLLCALGTPCIYYGTEQGFSGKGNDDAFIREAMFDLQDPQKNFLNQNCRIYNEISKIAILFSDLPPLRFGRMYFREISGNGIDFGLPQGNPCTLAFSRILADQEVSVAYNTSTTDQRQDFVIVDSIIQGARPHMSLLYSSRGRSGDIALHQHPNSSRFVQLVLDPMEFAILM
jgi:glycosidase